MSALVLAIVAAIALGGARPARAEKVASLSPVGYVNDFAGVLSAETTAHLTELCQELDQKAGAQIAVVTIHTLEGDTAADFANQLFKKWGVGPKGTDRGVLILVAVDDRKYWTEVGYGLEPILPDGKVGGFGREMLPYFRSGDYNGGITHITESIAQVIAADRGVSLTTPTQPRPSESGQPENSQRQLPAGAIFIGFLIFLALIHLVGRVMRAAFGGPVHRRGWSGFGSSWWIFWILQALLSGGGSRGSSGWGGSSGSSGWGGGGFGSGGFGGGGGFGGFGGGASGGGGAGGSW